MVTQHSLPKFNGIFNKRFGTRIAHNRMWRTIVALGIGEQRGGRWFLCDEDLEPVAQVLGLLPAPKQEG